MGKPSIYPTGVTIYNPEKCFNGYTLFPAIEKGATLVDMNGHVIRMWKDLQGMPNKLLPGGQVFGHLGERNRLYSYQDRTDLVQVDWDGNIIWSFNKHEFIQDPDEIPQWMARCHHDYQREGNPVGYYVPGMDSKTKEGTTLILAHENIVDKKISEKNLLDDCIYEVNWAGDKIWQWHAHEHFKEFNLTESAKNVLARNPNIQNGVSLVGNDKADAKGVGDWLHINSMSTLGPNKWYDDGDERFHPDNIIIDSREACFLAIIDKKTGHIAWQLGPDFYSTEHLRAIGPIIGLHHAHMIPQGLPGAGNILIFDNGGFAGYGNPSETSAFGLKVLKRDHSRIIEIDPLTLEIRWSMTAEDMGYPGGPVARHVFYSPLVSSAQRLPNGNTFITEGCHGRFIEVTAEKEVVWEYISPYFKGKANIVYRAYRYPYDYVPQVNPPLETPVLPIEITDFRVPGAARKDFDHAIVTVSGTHGYSSGSSACVEEVK